MAYLKLNLLAELGKLSQGKPTKAEPCVIAKLALDEIRGSERTSREDAQLNELERLYRLD